MKLKTYLETTILPRYSQQDLGHNETHIKEVLKYASKIIEKLPGLNSDVVMTAIYYHDLGNIIDRDTHHIISANIVLNDSRLSEWFTHEEIFEISEGCRNHRGSNKNKQNLTTLEKLINDADGCDSIDVDRMLERAFSYNYANLKYSNTLPEIYEEVYNHLFSKYGAKGYAGKFLLSETKEAVEGGLTERNKIFKNKNLFIRRLEELGPKLICKQK